ncbi:MAG: hypothetical protein LUC30_08485 [Clostridiales bacterium]|nr:hypothetical protein [Clostridiales bacterium]
MGEVYAVFAGLSMMCYTSGKKRRVCPGGASTEEMHAKIDLLSLPAWGVDIFGPITRISTFIRLHWRIDMVTIAAY